MQLQAIHRSDRAILSVADHTVHLWALRMMMPPRWRPFARRRFREDQEARARMRRGREFQEILWKASDEGRNPVPLGTITREGHQGDMDPELSEYLARQRESRSV